MDETSRRSGQLEGGLNKDAVVGDSEYLEHQPGRRKEVEECFFYIYLYT
jgi:hypothetical protein